MKKKRIFYLPIETKNRELLGKVLLSAKAAARGWVVVLGVRSKMKRVMPEVLPGFFPEISIPDHKLHKAIIPFSNAGHAIGNICEEGVVYPDAKDYCDRKVGVQALKYIKLFLATGQKQVDDVRTYREVAENQLAITGNCRFDILRPGLRAPYEVEAKKIVSSIGPYILVNTNFSLVNPHPSYGDRLKHMISTGKLSNQVHIDIWKELAAYKKGIMDDFMTALVDMPKAFNRKVVIRPHPSEDHLFWKNWADDKPNIEVIFQGDVNTWLMGADVLIHEGCTTGIESFLLDKPVIAYSRFQENVNFNNIPNEISMVASNRDDLYEMIAKARDIDRFIDDSDRNQKLATLKYYIENLDGDLAADRILNAMDELDIPDYTEAEIRKSFANSRNFGVKPNIIKQFARKAFGTWGKESSVQRQKFEGLELDEIMDPMKLWLEQGHIDTIPKTQEVGDGLFLITKH